MGILSLLLWTPVLGVCLLMLVPAQHATFIRLLSHCTAAVGLLLSLSLLIQYDPFNPALQFSENFILNTESGSHYALGVDGLSLPMLLLTALLFNIALFVSGDIQSHLKTWYCCLLLLEFGVIGVFLAQDWSLFYIFWEINLVPLFFLVDRWGGPLRHQASFNYLCHGLSGSLFILAGLYALGEYMPEQGGALMLEMAEAAQLMPVNEQNFVLISFLIGFGTTLPLFPLHTWLIQISQNSVMPVNLLVQGLILKLGAYGLLRVAVMLPVAVQAMQTSLLCLALFTLLYGGLLAWRQADLNKLLGYAAMSQMAGILLGMAALNLTGLTGAVLQMSAHGLIAATLCLLLGWLCQRTGTSNIQEFSALSPIIPRFAFLTTLTLLAGMSLPGTVGFIAGLHTIIGGFQRWGGWMIFFSLSLLISAAYAIRTIGLLFMGPTKPNMLSLTDISGKELAVAMLLVGMIIWLGFFPTTLINLSVASLAQLNSIMTERVL